MSGVRLLVGTRKGAFVLTADGRRDDWNVEGPLFTGWEIYHLNASPVDQDRLYASQSTGWHGQVIQRSDDGGKTWQPVGNEFTYDGVLSGTPTAAGTYLFTVKITDAMGTATTQSFRLVVEKPPPTITKKKPALKKKKPKSRRH